MDRLKEMAKRKAAEKEALEASAIEVPPDREEAKEREERNLNAEADKVCKIIVSHVEQYMKANGCEIRSKYELKANSVKFYFWGSKDGVSFLESAQIDADVITECYDDKNKISNTSVSIFRALEEAINARNAKPPSVPVQEVPKIKGFGDWGA